MLKQKRDQKCYGTEAVEAVELLKATGAALFGPRWKAPLAAHVGVTKGKVSGAFDTAEEA